MIRRNSLHPAYTLIIKAACLTETMTILTPWCRVPPEQLTGLQLVKKFPAFHGTRRFITALTSVRHLSLSWASPIQSTCPHPKVHYHTHKRPPPVPILGQPDPVHMPTPEGSLPHSQASATCPYPGPARSSPHAHTRRFSTALTSVRHLSLSWASPIQSTCPRPTNNDNSSQYYMTSLLRRV